MNSELRKEMFKSIDVLRESMQNSMQVSLDTYCEIISRIDLMCYLMLCDEKKGNQNE